VLLVLTHLVIFAPFPPGWKKALISIPFLAALINEGAGWLTRFVDPGLAWLKIAGFLTLQASLSGLLLTLAVFLARTSPKPASADQGRRPDPAEGNGAGAGYRAAPDKVGHA
jgi:hypothetical protein